MIESSSKWNASYFTIGYQCSKKTMNGILTFYIFFTDLVDFGLLQSQPLSLSPDVGLVDLAALGLLACIIIQVPALLRGVKEGLGRIFRFVFFLSFVFFFPLGLGLPSTLRQVELRDDLSS